MVKQIGKGGYGEVWMGKWRGGSCESVLHYRGGQLVPRDRNISDGVDEA